LILSSAAYSSSTEAVEFLEVADWRFNDHLHPLVHHRQRGEVGSCVAWELTRGDLLRGLRPCDDERDPLQKSSCPDQEA
jgi:hypothetical protein